MSHKFVLRHETALAQLSTSDTVTMPLGFSKKVSATLAWDNDDFCEETRSGKGTTHVTGGIILQRSDDTKGWDPYPLSLRKLIHILLVEKLQLTFVKPSQACHSPKKVTCQFKMTKESKTWPLLFPGLWMLFSL